jgi:hypothetical protein
VNPSRVAATRRTFAEPNLALRPKRITLEPAGPRLAANPDRRAHLLVEVRGHQWNSIIGPSTEESQRKAAEFEDLLPESE